MAVCSIHYCEYIWDSYSDSLDVRVNLTDLYLGHEGLTPEDAFAPDLEGRDITAQLSTADRRELFTCIRCLQLGYVADPAIGVDGSDNEMTIEFGPQCSISCRWWTDLPAEWEELREIIRILRGAEDHGNSWTNHEGSPAT